LPASPVDFATKPEDAGRCIPELAKPELDLGRAFIPALAKPELVLELAFTPVLVGPDLDLKLALLRVP